MKKYAHLAGLLLCSGCINVTSQQVTEGASIDKICIERNPEVIVKGFTDILHDALAWHGVRSQVYDTVPLSCIYRLTYVAYRDWDMTIFMSNAHLDLYKHDVKVGYADRHMPIGSGFDFSKWDSTTKKVYQLVDQLLGPPSQGEIDYLAHGAQTGTASDPE